MHAPIVRHYPLKTLRVCLVPLWAAQMHAPIVRRMHPTACFCNILQATDVELIHMNNRTHAHRWRLSGAAREYRDYALKTLAVSI